MASFLVRLTRIGILDGFSPKKTKEYRLANIYTLCAMMLMVINGIIQSAFGLYGAGLACFIALIGLLASFLFTARQRVLKAEVLAMASNYVGILASVLLYGEAYWNHLYLVLLIIAYLVIFGPRQKRLRNNLILLTAVLFVLGFFSGEGVLGIPDSGETGQFVIGRINLFLVILAVLIFFYAAILQNRVAEKRLSEIAIKAEKERQVKSDFLSVMSHEIRTPLNGILGVGHLLSTASSREELEENIGILNTSSRLLLTLVNDILDFNKLEAGKIELYERDFQLQDLLENTFQMFASKASDKNLNYQFQYDETIINSVIGDSSRINQVVSNLLSNAIKFSHRGAVMLRVGLVSMETQYQTIQVEVEDDGIGIQEEKQLQIFDEYGQAKTETSQQQEGTGLGLAICKKILGLLGSEIQVISRPGKGSKFVFQLTLKTRVEQRTVEQSVAKSRQIDLQKANILLVEDNPVNQMIMRKFFEKWKVDFQMASNGKEAIDLLEKGWFDLILMDIQMPVMNGLEATTRIRNSQRPYQNVPVIALTADVTIRVREQAKAAGMNAMVTKPFDPNDLLKTLKKHL